MRFTHLPLNGAFLVEPELLEDSRGAFARTFCSKEFSAHGLPTVFPQCNISLNIHEGTLRGMHFQKAPYQEGKLVRCTKGVIYDVIIDLRRDSDTYCGWYGAKLSEENQFAIYVPEGFAHGFVTLRDDSDVLYYMTEEYHPDCASTVRWDDPAFDIDWPIENPILNERDGHCADYCK